MRLTLKTTTNSMSPQNSSFTIRIPGLSRQHFSSRKSARRHFARWLPLIPCRAESAGKNPKWTVNYFPQNCCQYLNTRFVRDSLLVQITENLKLEKIGFTQLCWWQKLESLKGKVKDESTLTQSETEESKVKSWAKRQSGIKIISGNFN